MRKCKFKMVYLYEKDTARNKIIEGGKEEYWKLHSEYEKLLKKKAKKLKLRPDKIAFVQDEIEEILREAETNWIYPEGFAEEKIQEIKDEIQEPKKHKTTVEKVKEKLSKKFNK